MVVGVAWFMSVRLGVVMGVEIRFMGVEVRG